MDAETLNDLCLSFPGSTLTYPFHPQSPVYKVADRIFALALTREPLSVNLKCEPGLAVQLREAHLEIGPGYHMNKRHWNTVVLEGGLSEAMIHDLVEDSYDLVVSALPLARRRALRWRGDAR